LDRYLTQALPALSRTRVQALITEGHVLLKGKPTKVSLKLEGGEVLQVVIPAAEPTTILGEDIAFTLIYEDADVAVIDKPAGLTVHPSSTQRAGTLVNALVGKLHSLSGIGGELRPGIVHRLDKNTSGLIIVAKNDRAHQFLTEAFAARRVNKNYTAYVWGEPAPQGEWKQPIGRHPVDRKRFSIKATQSKTAHTKFTVVDAFATASKLDIELLTGRTHQIRVHAAENGFPLIGDKTYGRPPKKADREVREFPRQALHARELELELPSGKRRKFLAPLPADLVALEALLH